MTPIAWVNRLLLGELGLLPLEQRALPLAMVTTPDTSAQLQRWTETALDIDSRPTPNAGPVVVS